MKPKTLFKRGLSSLLALAMSISLMPAAAAAGGDAGEVSGLSMNNTKSKLTEYAIAQSAVTIPQTIEVRVKLPAGGDRRQIIFNNYTVGNTNSLGMELNADNTLRYWEQGSDKNTISVKFDGKDQDKTINICTDEWVLVSMVRDLEKSQLLTYIDGELAATTEVSGFHTGNLDSVTYFGTDSRLNYGLKGEIAEVRMWSDARTADEIRSYTNNYVTGEEEGLAHAWKFEQPDKYETKETVFEDLVEDGVDVITSGYRYEEPVEDPNERKGLRFDIDQKEYVQVQGTVSVPATVETWVKLDKGTNSRQIIMNNYGKGGDTWGIEVQTNNCLRYWESGSGGSANLYFNDINICTDEWMLISVVRDGANSQVKAYINGELKVTMDAKDESGNNTLQPTIAELTSKLCFGGDYHDNPDIHMNGSIHEVRMWSDIRTDDEIKEYYTQAVTGDEAGLDHLWNFAGAQEGKVFEDTVFADQVKNGFEVVAVGYPKDPDKLYPVTFQLNGGTAEEEIPDQSGKLGAKVTAPTVVPTRKNGTFTGWYKDSACTTLWNFETDTIAGPTTIYAGWDIDLASADLKVTGGVSFTDASDQLCAAERLADVPRTFEATVKLPKSPSPSGGVICGNWMDAGYYDYDLGYVNFEITADGQPRLYWQQGRRNQTNDGKQSVVIPGVDLRQNQWVHLAITFDDAADVVKCYINGNLVSTVENCTFNPVIPAQALKIGGDYRGTGGQTNIAGYNSNYFKGKIANVSVWSTVRSEEQIAADVASLQADGSVNTVGDGLLSGWSFQDEQAPIFRDLSGNENHVAEFMDWLYPDFAQGDYSMVALPDTQFLSQSYPESYKKLTKWVVDNEETYNIKALLHLGDMVNTNNDAQWNACTEAMAQLEESTIPWMPMRGNHDASDWFNRNFPYQTYGPDRAWFVESYEDDKLDQSCWQVTAGGRDYLILSLGWAPTEGAIAWAEDIIKANPDKNVILIAHAFMYWNGTHIDPSDLDSPAFTSSGQNIWDKLGAKYPNVVLGMGGHIGYPDLATNISKNGAGEDVTSILCDAQGIDYTYNLAMMMLMTFHEDSNKVDINWYSVSNDRLFRARNQFTITVPHVGETKHAVTVTDGSGSGSYEAGETVSITAAEQSGYTFDHWEVVSGDVTLENASGKATTFTMPAGAVSIKAVFVKNDSSDDDSSDSAPSYSITADTVEGGKIVITPKRAEKGDTVTITVKPDEGYELDTLKVFDKNGDKIEVTEKNGKYTFTMPSGKVTVDPRFVKTEQNVENPFADVEENTYYFDAVQWAVQNGITSGVDANTFAPNATCTRAQAVTFLWKAMGSPEAVTQVNPFADVPSDAYYYKAVLWASEQGITSGSSATTFSPDATVTRAQTVTFLWRTAGAPAASMGNSFADVAADAYYADATQWAAEQGITSGTSASTFAPDSDCTRGQIVTFLYRHIVK